MGGLALHSGFLATSPCQSYYVAWIDANVARRGIQAAAQAYLEFLFTYQAQATIATAYQQSRQRKGRAAPLPDLNLSRQYFAFSTGNPASGSRIARDVIYRESGGHIQCSLVELTEGATLADKYTDATVDNLLRRRSVSRIAILDSNGEIR
jgi:hypothetical protein